MNDSSPTNPTLLRTPTHRKKIHSFIQRKKNSQLQSKKKKFTGLQSTQSTQSTHSFNHSIIHSSIQSNHSNLQKPQKSIPPRKRPKKAQKGVPPQNPQKPDFDRF